MGSPDVRPPLRCLRHTMHKYLRIWEYTRVEELNIEALDGAAELFRALGSPVRLAMLQRLAGERASVNTLAAELGVSQPLVSQHLRVLRQQRLVTATRQGQSHIYAMSDEHVAHIVADAMEHSKER